MCTACKKLPRYSGRDDSFAAKAIRIVDQVGRSVKGGTNDQKGKRRWPLGFARDKRVTKEKVRNERDFSQGKPTDSQQRIEKKGVGSLRSK